MSCELIETADVAHCTVKLISFLGIFMKILVSGNASPCRAIMISTAAEIGRLL